MNKIALLDKIVAEFGMASAHPRGAFGHMEDCEREMVFVVIPVGATEPFAVASHDWENALVSLNGSDVRLVLLHAYRRNRGALRRLVAAIQGAGLTPVVIEPTGSEMPAIMRKWKWKKRRVGGTGWESYEEWRPDTLS